MPGGPYLIGLANQPRLWREMLQRVLDKTPGFITVDLVAERKGALPADITWHHALVEQVQLDWLVVSTQPDNQLPPQAQLWLDRIPSLSVMALHCKLATTQVFLKAVDPAGPRIMRFALNEMSLTSLAAILRYKYGDAQLPIPLAVLSAFRMGDSQRHPAQCEMHRS